MNNAIKTGIINIKTKADLLAFIEKYGEQKLIEGMESLVKDDYSNVFMTILSIIKQKPSSE